MTVKSLSPVSQGQLAAWQNFCELWQVRLVMRETPQGTPQWYLVCAGHRHADTGPGTECDQAIILMHGGDNSYVMPLSAIQAAIVMHVRQAHPDCEAYAYAGTAFA